MSRSEFRKVLRRECRRGSLVFLGVFLFFCISLIALGVHTAITLDLSYGLEKVVYGVIAVPLGLGMWYGATHLAIWLKSSAAGKSWATAAYTGFFIIFMCLGSGPFFWRMIFLFSRQIGELSLESNPATHRTPSAASYRNEDGALRVNCPQCSQRIGIDASDLGKTVGCPVCGEDFSVTPA